MASESKNELVEFLVRRAFDPVLEARPDGRSEAERRRLEHVQTATREEIERFRRYGSAGEVLTNFRRDLDSAPARKVHAELRSLGLPTLHEVQAEFEAKARDLGVRPS